MSLRQVHAYFSGCVQGVGFRFTTERIAESYPVTGFVRNVSDGRVELVGEGEEKELEAFLQKIRKSFLAQYIHGVEVQWFEPTGHFQNFSVGF
ncbi:MAG: acylphosphatase [Chlamydiae bacterium]|nr:acylphosphatase [Chlamydiota bacterium]MBI3266725.1 acylphosphatase [Chlamydiota bacterium]